jgi:T-complex protein 1 subunit epsilon
VEQYAIRAFGEALEQIPLALADNSGFAKLDALAECKRRQIGEKNPRIGVNCLGEVTF